MKFTMADLPTRQRYKILVSTVTPRPIAWVTTTGRNGVVNAAPYSFFNAMGDDPALVVLGLLKAQQTGDDKDTATNILETGEFVVNLVTEHDAETMNLSCVDAPRDVSEIEYAGIAVTPSTIVAPPMIASAPVSFECRKVEALAIGPRQIIVVGEVLVAHIKDEFILNRERLLIDTPAMKLIGRVHGPGIYVRSGDTFSLDRGAFDPDRLRAMRAAKDDREAHRRSDNARDD